MKEQLLDLFGEQVMPATARIPKVEGKESDRMSIDGLSSANLEVFCSRVAVSLWSGLQDDVVAFQAAKKKHEAAPAADGSDFFGLPNLWAEKIALFDALCWAFGLFEHSAIAPFDAVCDELDMDVARVRRTFARSLHQELRELFRVIRMALGESFAATVAEKLDDYVNLGNWRNQ